MQEKTWMIITGRIKVLKAQVGTSFIAYVNGEICEHVNDMFDLPMNVCGS